MKRYLFIFLLSFYYSLQANAQKATLKEIEKRGDYYFKTSTHIAENQIILIETDQQATAVSLEVSEVESFSGSYIISESDTFYLKSDEHFLIGNGKKKSNLVIFPESITSFILETGQLSGEIHLDFLNSGGIGINKKKKITPNLRKGSECYQDLGIISQEIWREGLPEPDYSRVFTNVSHLIIHHSATHTSNQDYTHAVRNIYLYHTQSNGWSDIGYNYLIAPDGTIFAGRDPGHGGEQDKVQGAHFCGRNNATMGICMLGTYTVTLPSDALLNSMVRLISWKADKEGINPLVKASHSAGNLFTISGHRDGNVCNTECPGSGFYQSLNNFRLDVNTYMLQCESDTLPDDLYVIYPSPSSNLISVKYGTEALVKHIEVFDLNGKKCFLPFYKEGEDLFTASVTGLYPGLYIIQIVEEEKIITRRFIKI